MSGERAEWMGWRAALVCALLWGAAVMLADSLSQPVGALSAVEWLKFSAQLFVQWTAAGTVWVFGARFVRGRYAPFIVLLLLLALAVTINSLIIHAPITADGAKDAFDTGFETYIPLLDAVSYASWLNTFFGGLYLIGYLVTRRAAALRRRLGEIRLSRSRSALQLSETRIGAFRGQVQPAMLLRALSRLRELYAIDELEADLLFDRLIAFLRAAMPSIRSGVSTLPAEIDTIRQYAELRRSMNAPGTAWQVIAPEELPPIAFPSLMLLPALESVGGTAAANGALRLTARFPDNDRLVLRIEADTPALLPEKMDSRLRASVALIFGQFATVSSGRELPIEIIMPATVWDEATNQRSTGELEHDKI